MGKNCSGDILIDSRDSMSQYEVQIPGSVINITIDHEDSQRRASSNASDSYSTAMPHVTSSSVPESSLGYHGPSGTMWPLFPGAPSNYLYEVHRMEIFRAMNQQQQQQQQRQLSAYPIPSIQYPDYMARMPSEIPIASPFDELSRSCNVSAAESYRPPYLQAECSSTAHEATSAATATAASLLETEEQAVASRKPNCARCRNHDFKVAVKGHKRHCPFKDCECDKCILIKERQVLMKKQLSIKQRQHDVKGAVDLAPVQQASAMSSTENPSATVAPLQAPSAPPARISNSSYDTAESHLPPIKRRKVIEANAKASLGES